MHLLQVFKNWGQLFVFVIVHVIVIVYWLVFGGGKLWGGRGYVRFQELFERLQTRDITN